MRRLLRLTPRLRRELKRETGRLALSVVITWALVSLISCVYAGLLAMVTGYWSIAATTALAAGAGGTLVIVLVSLGLAALAAWIHASALRHQEEDDSGKE